MSAPLNALTVLTLNNLHNPTNRNNPNYSSNPGVNISEPNNNPNNLNITEVGGDGPRIALGYGNFLQKLKEHTCLDKQGDVDSNCFIRAFAAMATHIGIKGKCVIRHSHEPRHVIKTDGTFGKCCVCFVLIFLQEKWTYRNTSIF